MKSIRITLRNKDTHHRHNYDTSDLKIPTGRLMLTGFSVAATTIWNQLPTRFKSSNIIDIFVKKENIFV